MLERGQRYQYSPTRAVFGNDLFPRNESFWYKEIADWPYTPPVPLKPVPGILEVNHQDGITIGCGAGVGGGSLVYTGCTVQPPRRYFEALWPSGISYAELDKVYYPKVRSMISARTVPVDVYRTKPFTHSRTFDQQLAAAGYPTTPVPSIFNWDKVRGELSGKLRPSAIIGESTFGNSDGAKNDMTQTYLPLALETGRVSISPLTEVTSITTRPGGGYLVEVRHLCADGGVARTEQLGCDMLFLAAGSVGTTKLLVAARDSGTLSNLNSSVGRNWGTNGDAITLRGALSPLGTTQAAPCVSTAFVPTGFGVPIRVENWYALQANDLPGMVQFSVAVDMDNRGTWKYEAEIGTVMLTDWNDEKNDSTQNAARAFNQMIIDKGLALPGGLPAPSALTAHPLGGCEIGKATDLHGRVQGYSGLYVVDGALAPGNVGGANPSLTIAAIAERCMAEIVSRGG
jgi:cholesterol oxidase